MQLRTLAFTLVPLFASSLAFAQAPGEVAPQVVVAPVIAPVVVAPAAAPAPAPGMCGSPRESVMANRWSIGLSVGSMGLAPESAPDRNTQFAIGELALRFRATPRFELELSVGGGREQTADHEEGDLEVSAAALAARFRFRPEAAWNWFVMAGVGGAAVARHDATEQEREDATRPLGMLGIGVERRFRHFAFQAEARALGIGDKQRDEMVERANADVSPMGTVVTPIATDEPRSGGSLSIGVSYYF